MPPIETYDDEKEVTTLDLRLADRQYDSKDR